MDIISLLLLAIFAESIWETLKLVWEKDKLSVDRLGSIVVGIVLAVSTGVDFFTMLGLPVQIPYLGSVFTGIIASRGANFVHDLLKIAEAVKVKNKV